MATLTYTRERVMQEFTTEGTVFGSADINVIQKRHAMDIVALRHGIDPTDYRAVAAIANHDGLTVDELKIRETGKFLEELKSKVENLRAQGQLSRLAFPLFEAVEAHS